jgi:hypothetical protein
MSVGVVFRLTNLNPASGDEGRIQASPILASHGEDSI